MVTFILIIPFCIMAGVGLGILARGKGYNYQQWFFIGVIPAFFPFGLIWMLLLKKAELKDRDISGYEDNDFVRKMIEFDKEHK